MSEAAFRIQGLDCAEEVAVLKRELGPLVGGEQCLAFDVLRGKLTVSAAGVSAAGVSAAGVSAAGLSSETISAAVARTGMKAVPWTEADAGQQPGNDRRVQNLLTAGSGLATAAGFAAHVWSAGGLLAALGSEGSALSPSGPTGIAHTVPPAAMLLYLLVIVFAGWYVLPKALYAVRRLRPDMNLLMTVAVAGAVVLGEWFEAATVAFLFAFSNALEAWSVGRARRAVEALMDLSPTTARVKSCCGEEREVDATEVPVGALLVIHPGEKVPLDGTVVEGRSEIDQAPITGESVPVPKAADDEVFAGTINGSGVLEVRSTRTADDTTLANIIRLVEQAQSRRSPSEQWVEKFARVYTPAVMALALAVAVVPPLAAAAAWGVWFYRALVLLVIACPCALVISTPVSIVAAIAAAARSGVLIKGGVFIEAPARLKAIAFDKTGTLTEGEPSVVEVVPFAEHDESQLLARAAALETRSEHPLARAVLRHAEQRGVEVAAAEHVRALPGQGVQGRFGDKTFWLGSHRYLEQRGQETAEVHDMLERMSDAGRTIVVVGNDAHVCGFIAVADGVRPEARRALDALRREGLHLVMLTGDNHGTARAIGRRTGVSDVRAELLPLDKVETVEQLVETYGAVAMVGDGVNDAPAMARASLGIAMGSAGSDAAVEAADVALMSDDLSKLPWLVRHSRRTLGVIHQNVVFALGVKLAVFALATLGLATLWMAIAADMGASLLVIANGLRLLRA